MSEEIRPTGTTVVITVDSQGTIESVTDAIVDLLGWNPGDLVGCELLQLIPQRFREPHSNAFARFVTTGRSHLSGQSIHLPALAADGSELDVDLALARRTEGDQLKVVGILRARGASAGPENDALIDRVRRELQHLIAADRSTQEVLAAAIGSVASSLDWPIGVIWAFDPWVDRLTAMHVWERDPGSHPTYVDATRQARFSVGEGFADQVWQTFRTWWSSDLSGERAFRRAESAARDGIRSGVFVPIHAASGVIGVIELVDECERGVDASTHLLLDALSDELGRHLGERFRRDTESIHRERLQLALSGGRMGMWTFHIPSGQVTWDPMLETIHGLVPGTFGGTFEAFASAVHPDDRESVLDTVGEAVAHRRRFDVDYRTITGDGSTRWVRGSGAPLIDQDGELQMMTGIGRDVSDEVLDTELLRRRASSAALAADVGRALVGHEAIGTRLQRVVDAAVGHLGVALARVWTLDAGDDVLVLGASAGLYTHLDGEHSKINVGDLKIGEIASARRAHVSNDLLDDPRLSDPEWARREGMRAFAGFPLTAQERCVGVLAVFARHQLSGDVVGSLASITDSLAVAIVQHQEAERVRELLNETQRERERAERLLVERRRVASLLQETLLPPVLPRIVGLDVAGAYRAGVEAVGGDFYDLFPVDANSWGFMIGDVCGKGPEAARHTALARHTLRTALQIERRPSRALHMLDRALHDADVGGRFCTAVCGLVEIGDADEATLTIAVAGHPAPLVLRSGHEVEQLATGGPLLGIVPDATFDDEVVKLGPADALILYTDGMIEARSADGLFGLARLCEAAAAVDQRNARSITDGLVQAVTEYDEMRTHDDLAVLTIRRV